MLIIYKNKNTYRKKEIHIEYKILYLQKTLLS